MPEAKSLKDLLLIRNANKELLEKYNSSWGTALGRKNETGDPAILVFVSRKIHRKWLPASEVVPQTLGGPDGLTCLTDVIQAEGFDFPRPSSLVIGQNLDLRDDLQGASDKLRPGSQLAFLDSKGEPYLGTLSCIVRNQKSQRLGLLTNAHIGDYVDNVLKHPGATSREVAVVKTIEKSIMDQDRFPGIIDEPYAYYKIEAAFAEFLADISKADDIDTYLSYIDSSDKRISRQLGQPMQLDLNTMVPIGQRVLGVGSTRSCQRGTIFAFAYEYRDEENNNWYTDYLIASEMGEQFSDDGDSGKLVVTDDQNLQPVAMLWGGTPSPRRVRKGRQEEDLSYAIDINIVLNRLQITIER